MLNGRVGEEDCKGGEIERLFKSNFDLQNGVIMSSQTRGRQKAPQHGNRPGQSEPVASSTGILVVSSLEHGSGRRSQLSEHGSASERAEARATETDTEEVLIADLRGAVTPAQMVERKLRALL